MYFLVPCTTLLREVRLRLGSAKENCLFLLRCTRLALLCCAKSGCVSVVQKKIGFFFCVALALHYFCSAINGSWFFQVKEPAAMKARTLTLL